VHRGLLYCRAMCAHTQCCLKLVHMLLCIFASLHQCLNASMPQCLNGRGEETSTQRNVGRANSPKTLFFWTFYLHATSDCTRLAAETDTFTISSALWDMKQISHIFSGCLPSRTPDQRIARLFRL
jgi:hypothetical protein